MNSNAEKIPVTNAATGDLYASSEKVYTRHFYSGFFQRIRVATVWLTLGVYFLGPWLTWDGRQAVLFDLPARKFYVFGFTFWPQDFLFLSWALIIAAFALFLVTVFAGRVWCGYTCPQTVWTMVFMWIEYHTEGDRNQRMKLDKQSVSTSKLGKKTVKHGLWLLLAFWTAFTFVGYFYSIKSLAPDLLSFAVSGWTWAVLTLFTVLTYLNAGWMREQVCKYMCPYARFQSVMFDRNTLIVTYDAARGEPRGHRKKNADAKEAGLGDCVDCKMCVQVCPTGIDIRNGLQYDCIGCAACIDACDSIMERLDMPKGLVRYSTENAIEGKDSHIVRPRLLAYAAVLLVMCGLYAFTLYSRVPLGLDIIRDRGALFRENMMGNIENSYTLKVMNKTQQPQVYSITAEGIEGLNLILPRELTADPGELLELAVTLEASPGNLTSRNTVVHFTVETQTDPVRSVTEESRFLGPRK